MPITIVTENSKANPKHLVFGSEEIKSYIEVRMSTRYDNPTTGAENQFVDDILFACRELMRSGKKIAAIKLIRGCFPVGLKEAKDFVELNYPE